MFKLLVLTIAVVQAVSATPTNDRFYGVSSEFIEKLNTIEKDWVAGKNFDEDLPKEYFLSLVGHVEPHRKNKLYEGVTIAESRPKNYDPRTEIPNCPSLLEIRNQAHCGSCWAFGAVETMTDRTCILSNGTVNFHYSADDLLSCCKVCGFGCAGGWPDDAFRHWVERGIVSGGPFGSKQGCRPYEKDTCSRDEFACSDETPECKKECIQEYDIEYSSDLHFGETSYYVGMNEDEIESELFLKGPIEASFAVYEDFFDYRSGIYHHVYGEFVGYHAVKLMGYGVEDDIPYWLLANSWDYGWGDNGFFKMRRRNECEIQESLVTGTPAL